MSRHSLLACTIIVALSALPFQLARACSASAWWESSLELYGQSVAVYTAKIKSFEVKDRTFLGLEDIEDAFESFDEKETLITARLDVVKAWKRKRNVRAISLSFDYDYVDRIVVGQPYLIFVCEDREKNTNSKGYTACGIYDAEYAENIPIIQTYLLSSDAHRDKMLRKANGDAIAVCMRLYEIEK